MDVFKIQSSSSTPWNASRAHWHGEIVSVDGADTTMPAPEDVVELVAHGDTGPDWEGMEVVVVRLADGRFVSWVDNYGPTGSGFSEDAYGGDAIAWFSSTVTAAISLMSEREHELIKDQLLDYVVRK